MKKAVPRPSWWTPEKVLELLQNGATPVSVINKAYDEMDGAVSTTTLSTDLRKWKNSATWGDKFTFASKIVKGGKHSGKISKKWYKTFYNAMEEHEGRIAESCQAIGVGVDIIYALRDKRNKQYDPEFDQNCRILEGKRFSVIRENLLEKAETDGKLGSRVLESAMPNLHATRHSIEVTGKVDHTHLALSAAVVEASASRTRNLLEARRQKELPAHVDVIEGEVVSE